MAAWPKTFRIAPFEVSNLHLRLLKLRSCSVIYCRDILNDEFLFTRNKLGILRCCIYCLVYCHIRLHSENTDKTGNYLEVFYVIQL